MMSRTSRHTYLTNNFLFFQLKIIHETLSFCLGRHSSSLSLSSSFLVVLPRRPSSSSFLVVLPCRPSSSLFFPAPLPYHPSLSSSSTVLFRPYLPRRVYCRNFLFCFVGALCRLFFSFSVVVLLLLFLRPCSSSSLIVANFVVAPHRSLLTYSGFNAALIRTAKYC